MARIRPRPSNIGLFGAIVFMVLAVLTLGVSASSSGSSPSSSSSALASTPSPAVEVELICHTDNPAECYPKVFVPTNDFQVVHVDQEIPPGLHVRVDVNTGKKEAKINIADEKNADLEGLPVDIQVVVVEPEEEEIKIPAGAPVYEAVGKIKEPPKSAESERFYDALENLRKGLNVDEALEELEELSHDIYYGLKIAEDYDIMKALFCLANTERIFQKDVDPAILKRARLAALTIAGALQNNAKALKEVEKHWATLRGQNCDDVGATLDWGAFRLIAPWTSPYEDPLANDASLTKARAAAINGLIKSGAIRKDFLENDGMGRLLEVLVLETGPEWEGAKKKVALLVQDNFLDENMGATLGEWPVNDQSNAMVCKSAHEGGLVSGQCWDWEADRLAQEHKSDDGHWSHELWNRLKEAKKSVETDEPRVRDEL